MSPYSIAVAAAADARQDCHDCEGDCDGGKQLAHSSYLLLVGVRRPQLQSRHVHATDSQDPAGTVRRETASGAAGRSTRLPATSSSRRCPRGLLRPLRLGRRRTGRGLSARARLPRNAERPLGYPCLLFGHEHDRAGDCRVAARICRPVDDGIGPPGTRAAPLRTQLERPVVGADVGATNVSGCVAVSGAVVRLAARHGHELDRRIRVVVVRHRQLGGDRHQLVVRRPERVRRESDSGSPAA